LEGGSGVGPFDLVFFFFLKDETQYD